MAVSHGQLDTQQRFAEKERVRRVGEQLKQESESFAFPKERARVNLKSARSLV